MNFYMPCTECDEQAEMIWSGLRQRLAGLGLPTTRRRIAAVSPDDRPDLRFEVGQSHPHSGELILLILETSGLGLYWIFTQNHGLARGVPYPVIDETGSAIAFEESALERLWGDYLR
ncbi:MAG TPA: hypothetical protein VGA98_05080 [Allosphingosinicella sp.]